MGVNVEMWMDHVESEEEVGAASAACRVECCMLLEGWCQRNRLSAYLGSGGRLLARCSCIPAAPRSRLGSGGLAVGAWFGGARGCRAGRTPSLQDDTQEGRKHTESGPVGPHLRVKSIPI